MIKAILLDWGGVISPGGTPDEVPASLAKTIGLDDRTAKLIIKQYSKTLKTGKIDDNTFWENIEQEIGKKVPKNKRNIWTPTKYFEPDKKLLNYVQKLQSKGMQVGVLSNVFPATAKAIKKMGWYDYFDPVVISTVARYAKPEPEIYQLAIDKFGLKPQEILFVDDQQYCIDGANKMSLETLLADNPDDIISGIEARLSGL